MSAWTTGPFRALPDTHRERLLLLTRFAGFVFNFSNIFCDCCLVARALILAVPARCNSSRRVNLEPIPALNGLANEDVDVKSFNTAMWFQGTAGLRWRK